MTAVTSILEHVCFSTQRNFRGPSEGGVLLKINHVRVSLVAQMVKNLPAMLENWVQSLGWKDPLEEGMATHSSILVWRIPKDRRAWRAAVHGVAKSWIRLSN